MSDVWYQPFMDALREHIEQNHTNQEYYWDEIRMTSEEYAYMEVGDDEKITLRCPWREHCSCDWEIEGHIVISLRNFKVVNHG